MTTGIFTRQFEEDSKIKGDQVEWRAGKCEVSKLNVRWNNEVRCKSRAR
jgi:hypothetical protein